MMPYNENEKTLITKENADVILKAFAKEYKKINGSRSLEIIIVGGGSILLNYGFREYTQDFDVMVRKAENIKDISYRVAELYNLPMNWLNTDFTHTASYSDKLREVSKHYRTFNNGSLEFRTIQEEYLIAMKMVSARDYRNDISDIIGILMCMLKNNTEISIEKIESALCYLYPNMSIKEEVYEKVRGYLELSIEELEKEYLQVKNDEGEIEQNLVWIDKKYPKAVTEKSIDSITKMLREKIEKSK